MKRRTIIVVMVVCIMVTYLLCIRKRLDPSVKSVESITVMKMKPNQIMMIDNVYIENDSKKIAEIINAMKKRVREPHTGRYNSYNYALDITLKDRKNTDVDPRYAIWIENNRVYMTIASVSDDSYILSGKSAEFIKKYLTEINLREP